MENNGIEIDDEKEFNSVPIEKIVTETANEVGNLCANTLTVDCNIK
jgi:hypothetical protein